MNKIESTKKFYYDIVPAYNIQGTLLYSSKIKLKTGSLVAISIRKKIVVGCILNTYKSRPKKNFHVKDIEEYFENYLLGNKNIIFFKWVSNYNFLSLGASFKLIISDLRFLKPIFFSEYSINNVTNFKLTKKQIKFLEIIKSNSTFEKQLRLGNFSNRFIENLIKKGIVNKSVCIKKKNLKINLKKISLKKLKRFQEIAYNKIIKTIQEKNLKPLYLDGVTGSGKTEVYFKLIEYFLKKKKQVLILIPEIALGEQLVKRFSNVFNFDPLIWNSSITYSKKKIIWQAAIEGEPMVVVGARSSVFLPFLNLGITIIDEENDSSYKQDESPVYNARNMAIVKAKINNSFILLVSATPSLETYNNFRKKKYNYVRLSRRYGLAKDPKVIPIDMKKSKGSVFASETLEIIKNKIKSGKQILILINKRGYAPITICSKCGKKETCDSCDINLVFHKNKKLFICHHCGKTKRYTQVCNDCNVNNTKISLGFGIEKVNEEIKKEFENVNRISLSSENFNQQNFANVLTKIEKGNIKIIIGTQIISKGFDFLKLNSVFVLDFDLWFYNTDIRTNEKIFQLTQQVSGRTSRDAERGEVYIQTYDTKNYLLKQIISNDRNSFYENELMLRKKIFLPPYSKLIAIILSSKDITFLKSISEDISKILSKFDGLLLLGPIPAPVEYIKYEYRYRLLIKTNHSFLAQKALKNCNFDSILKNKAKMKIDVDPLSFF